MPTRQAINPDARPDGSVTLEWQSVIFCPFCGINHNLPDTYPNDDGDAVEMECYGCGRTFWYTLEIVHYFHCHPEDPDA